MESVWSVNCALVVASVMENELCARGGECRREITVRSWWRLVESELWALGGECCREIDNCGLVMETCGE